MVNLTFIASADEAVSVHQRWTAGRKQVAICLDEALFTTEDAALIFGDRTQIVGRSQLGLCSESIFQEAMSLATAFCSANDASWPSRVQGWRLESYKRWFIYAVHSIRLIEDAFRQFEPTRVWVPEYSPLRLTLSPDTEPGNPLFFDLLPSFCRFRGVEIDSPVNDSHSPLRPFIPLKYVLGEWLSRVKARKPAKPEPPRRPIIIGNLDNDFHRQFDLSRINDVTHAMLAWVRGTETVIPVDQLLDLVGVPNTTRFSWFDERKVDLTGIACSAGVKVRLFAGWRYFFQFVRERAQQRRRFQGIQQQYDLPWADLLFGTEVPSIHDQCRIAADFYCMFEYERARSLLLHCQPDLFVTSADHWPFLPHIEAAKELGVRTLSTESGLSFLQDNFAQKEADIICVFGETDAVRVAKRRPEARIVQGGDALTFHGHITRHCTQVTPRQILLVTSGQMFGWWFGSLLFDYRAYGDSLAKLGVALKELTNSPQVVIKSHPVSDLHHLYDKLVAQHNQIFVEHRKEPLSDEQIAHYDVAVVFSAATTFLAELIRARVPVIYFDGALTEFGKGYFDYEGLTVVHRVEDLVARLIPLLNSKDATARELVLRKGDTFLSRYVAPGGRPFSWVIEEVLGSHVSESLSSSGSMKSEADFVGASKKSHQSLSDVRTTHEL